MIGLTSFTIYIFISLYPHGIWYRRIYDTWPWGRSRYGGGSNDNRLSIVWISSSAEDIRWSLMASTSFLYHLHPSQFIIFHFLTPCNLTPCPFRQTICLQVPVGLYRFHCIFKIYDWSVSCQWWHQINLCALTFYTFIVVSLKYLRKVMKLTLIIYL